MCNFMFRGDGSNTARDWPAYGRGGVASAVIGMISEWMGWHRALRGRMRQSDQGLEGGVFAGINLGILGL